MGGGEKGTGERNERGKMGHAGGRKGDGGKTLLLTCSNVLYKKV